MSRHQFQNQAEKEGGSTEARQAALPAQVADPVVPELGPDAERLAELERLAKRYRLTRFGTFAKSVLPLVIVGEAAVVALMGLFSPILGTDVAAGAGAAAMAAAVVPATLWSLARAGRKYVSEVTRLAAFQGVPAIPPLLHLLRADLRPGRNQWSPLRDALRVLLTDLLPQIRASDAALLDRQARQTLNDLLARAARYYGWPGVKWVAWRRRRMFEPSFIVAALRALEQVGDESAIPHVEALAALTGDAPAVAEIRDAAERCLPLLRVSSRKVEDARTLVRPAGPVPEEGLLRPVEGAPPADPDSLLRPAAADDPPPDGA